jgi:hypothetical protein
MSIDAIELHDSLIRTSSPISHATQLDVDPPIQQEKGKIPDLIGV